MLRIVFDSNVYISALLFHGVPGKILGMASKNELTLITSEQIILETTRILKEKFDWPQHNTEKFIRRLSVIGENIKPEIKLSVIKERESDNRVLECAVCGDANLIVTGDKHLLNLKKYENIPIVRPVYLTYLITGK